MKIKRLMYSATAIVLTGAMVVTSIHFSKTEASAMETFQGITEIVEQNSEENPFIIAEIVPDKATVDIGGETLDVSMGMLGYYIGGSEPAKFEENLSKLHSFSERKEYVDLFSKGDGTGCLSSLSVSGDAAMPLRYVGYQEAYNFELVESDYESAAKEGNPWKHFFESDEEGAYNHEEYVYDRKPDLTIEGGPFIKKYSCSENVITDLSGLGSDKALNITLSRDGDFDPNLVLSDSGSHIVTMSSNSAKRGYRVSEAIKVYKDSTDVGDDTPIYTTTVSGDFVFVGKYSVVKSSLPDEPAGLGPVGNPGEDPSEDPADEPDEEVPGDENPGGDEPGDEVPGETPQDTPDDNPENDPQDTPESSEGDDSDDSDSPSEGDGGNGDQGAEEGAEAIISHSYFCSPIMIASAADGDDSGSDGDDSNDDGDDSNGDGDDSNGGGDDSNGGGDDSNGRGDDSNGNGDDSNGSGDDSNGGRDGSNGGDEGAGMDEGSSELDENAESKLNAYIPEDANSPIIGEIGEYYALVFEYSTEASEDEAHYSVVDIESAGDSLVKYNIDSVDTFVTNYDCTGYIKDTNNYPLDFAYVYAVDAENNMEGNYSLIVDADETSYIRVIGISVCYRGPFINNEWFKKYVFDREFDLDSGNLMQDVDIEYVALTPQEFANYNVDGIGLVYVANPDGSFLPSTASSTKSYGSDNDLTDRTVYDIVSSVVKNDLPVMIDESILEGVRGTSGTNLQKLAILLQQKSVDVFFDDHEEEDPYEFLINDMPDDWFNDDDKAHHVNESVYVYNYNSLFSLNTEFTVDFSDTLIETCFQEIIEEIQNENYYREVNRVDKKNWIPERVNEAVAIKYIISYSNRRGATAKESLNVLDVQPCVVKGETYLEMEDDDYSSKLTKLRNDKSEGNLYVVKDKNDKYSLYRVGSGAKDSAIIRDQKSPIKLYSMSASEFVGHEEDLNSDYDLIYFGMSTKFMNTVNGRTVYNDRSNMNGLVYTNIGDTVQLYSAMGGWIGSELNGTVQKNENVVTRYTGNDISSFKVTALKEYLKAGYPVIVDYHFYEQGDMTSGTVDKSYVDVNSYMYEFFDWAGSEVGVNSEKNLFRVNSRGEIDTKLQSRLEWYMNLPKPHIVNDESYATTETLKKAEKRSDGSYRMEYRFSITDLVSTDPDTRYDAMLYIDANSDGKFSESEIIDSFVVADEDSSRDNGRLAYKLQAGKDYYAYYNIPEELDGPLPWKLAVSVRDSEFRRDSIIGCYFVNKSIIDINVLQIIPDSGAEWILEKGKDSKFDDIVNPPYKDINNDPLAHYNITIKTMKSKEFMDAYSKNTNLLDGYSLIILGFGTRYRIFKDAGYTNPVDVANAELAHNALVNYVRSGRSVLIGSGIITDLPVEPSMYRSGGAYAESDALNWGYYLSHDLRDEIGMDRYGVAKKANSGIAHAKAFVPGKKGSIAKEIHGFSNVNNDTLRNTRVNQYAADTINFNARSHEMGNAPEIKGINDGQLTFYPYDVHEDKIISNNSNYSPIHALNLEQDDDEDKESDVLVWYTYEKLDMNNVIDYQTYSARDMYFLYTKKNVTFINSRNTAWSNGLSYFKLIVNTMIASYEAGVKNPVVRIVTEPDVAAEDLETIYIPEDYDTNETLNVEDGTILSEDINYYIYGADKRATLVTNYFVESDGTIPGTVEKTVNGETKLMAPLDPYIQAVYEVEDGVKTPIAKEYITVGDRSVNGYRNYKNKPYQFEVVLKNGAALDLLGKRDNVNIYVETNSLLHIVDGAPTQVMTVYDNVMCVRTQLFNLD